MAGIYANAVYSAGNIFYTSHVTAGQDLLGGYEFTLIWTNGNGNRSAEAAFAFGDAFFGGLVSAPGTLAHEAGHIYMPASIDRYGDHPRNDEIYRLGNLCS